MFSKEKTLQAGGVSCLGVGRGKGAGRPPKPSCASFRFAGGVSVYPQLELSLWPQLPQPRPSPAHAKALAFLFWLRLLGGVTCLIDLVCQQSPDSRGQPNRCLTQGSSWNKALAVWSETKGQESLGPQRPEGMSWREVGGGWKLFDWKILRYCLLPDSLREFSYFVPQLVSERQQPKTRIWRQNNLFCSWVLLHVFHKCHED